MAITLKSVLGTIGSVAPTIAKAIGGPLAGTAIEAIADALGMSGSDEQAVAKAIAKATPEQLLAMKQADQAFELKMKELDIDLDKAYIDDTANARQTHRDNKSVFWLGIAILVTFAMVMGSVIWGYFAIMTGTYDVVDLTLATTASGMIGTIVGYVAGNAQQVVSYFFGSSRGSNDKTAAMASAVAKIGQK